MTVLLEMGHDSVVKHMFCNHGSMTSGKELVKSPNVHAFKGAEKGVAFLPEAQG